MRTPLDGWDKVHNGSNPFGFSSEEMKQYYRTTWTHVGSDFAVPRGTPIFAPADGDMLVAVNSDPKGFTGVFCFTHMGVEYGLELCHLQELPKLGNYKEGDIIAITGNTGKYTTGAHLHCVLHRDCRVTKNYQELSTGPAGAEGRQRFLRMVQEGKLINPYEWFRTHAQESCAEVCKQCNRPL